VGGRHEEVERNRDEPKAPFVKGFFQYDFVGRLHPWSLQQGPDDAEDGGVDGGDSAGDGDFGFSTASLEKGAKLGVSIDERQVVAVQEKCFVGTSAVVLKFLRRGWFRTLRNRWTNFVNLLLREVQLRRKTGCLIAACVPGFNTQRQGTADLAHRDFASRRVKLVREGPICYIGGSGRQEA